ncbi:MAG: hypothetical protein JRI72_00285 [Deltaproteobacteria bacterium]|nr:hypothetical protein [Deltaproteobacteria bacterium]
MQGWVKLHRQIIENPIFRKPHMLQLFVYCVLKANHEQGKAFWGKDEITVERGQFVAGRFEIALALNQNPNTTYARLKRLESGGFLNIKSNNKYSLINVVNYELYQSDEQKSNSKMNKKITTNEQQNNTNKNVRMKECKKKDSRGKKFIPPSLEEVKSYCKERGNKVDPAKWHDFYTAKNWMIGKNKMKDWKAAVRTWEKRGNDNSKIPQAGNFEQRNYDDDFFDNLYKRKGAKSNEEKKGH